MKLLIRRSQKKGIVGSITFILDSRAELTPEEKENVKKYKMGKEILYYKEKVDLSKSDPETWSGIARGLAARALNIKITVDDVVNGKSIECKDILEMRAAEEQLKEACGLFKTMLESAAHFEGEQVIEF
ncbi:MAG: hypothetical protein MN733_08755 [Nitrososphaera sp.]|nr:hypothetical protein [Nitrososphaera sp.]